MNIPPGTRVTLDDPDYGTWHGHVTVCLCKRHVWQQQVGEGGPGRECGHARCGYPRAAEACPWPMHVVWDNGNESHQGMDGLTVVYGAAQIIREVGWRLRRVITPEAYLRDLAYAKDLKFPVREWRGEDREGKAMVISWIVTSAGNLLSAYEIQDRA